MNMRKLTSIPKLAIVAAGLLAPLFAPSAVAEQQGDASAFARGANSWAQNCARCHNMRDAKEFRDDQWKVIVTHMRVRAGLTGQEARDILRFLQANN
ncbi:MAG: cytochrome c [Pseudomonadota bacterium]